MKGKGQKLKLPQGEAGKRGHCVQRSGANDARPGYCFCYGIHSLYGGNGGSGGPSQKHASDNRSTKNYKYTVIDKIIRCL